MEDHGRSKTNEPKLKTEQKPQNVAGNQKNPSTDPTDALFDTLIAARKKFRNQDLFSSDFLPQDQTHWVRQLLELIPRFGFTAISIGTAVGLMVGTVQWLKTKTIANRSIAQGIDGKTAETQTTDTTQASANQNRPASRGVENHGTPPPPSKLVQHPDNNGLTGNAPPPPPPTPSEIQNVQAEESARNIDPRDDVRPPDAVVNEPPIVHDAGIPPNDQANNQDDQARGLATDQNGDGNQPPAQSGIQYDGYGNPIEPAPIDTSNQPDPGINQ